MQYLQQYLYTDVTFSSGINTFINTDLVSSGSVDRMLDKRSKHCYFETHMSHCVVSLSKRLYPLLSTGSTEADRN